VAQYRHLPIYRLTYELLQRVMEVTKDFPREHKFTLGQKIKDEVIEIVLLIYRANSSDNKTAHIEVLLEKLQVVELLLRLSHDMRLIPLKSYAAVIEMTESLGKQAQGWKKASGSPKTRNGK
jgi:hypothetical protein